MKPLELNIYEKHPDADAYRVGGFYSPYCLVSRDKRFTGAELAAEYWYAVGYYVERKGAAMRGGKSRAMHEVVTLHRFAALPHYDEADQ